MAYVFAKIHTTCSNIKEHAIVTQTQGLLPLHKLTEKLMYYEILVTHYCDHHSLERWFRRFPQLLAQDWKKIGKIVIIF